MEAIQVLPHGDRDADDVELLRQLTHAVQPSTACPDPNELAAWAEHALTPEARDELDRHIATCRICQEISAGLAALAPTELMPRPATLRLRQWAPLAAALLATLGLVVWLATRTTPTWPARQAAVIAAFAATLPDAARNFTPFAAGELQTEPRATRGAAVAVSPAGVTLEARPRFRWSGGVPGSRWTLQMRRADGTPMWSASTHANEIDWPADQTPPAPNETYLWSVEGDGLFGTARATRTFRTASEQERAEAAAVRSFCAEATDHAAAQVLLLHWLLRREHVDAAVTEARRLLASPGRTSSAREDAAVDALLRHALALLGETSANPR